MDGANERHFVNGAFVEEVECAGVLSHNDSPFKIGARGDTVDGHSSQFRGTVDEAMLAIAQPDCATVQIIFNMLRCRPAEDFLPAAKAADVRRRALPASLL